MEPNVTLKCGWCQRSFPKSAREHRRQVKTGRTWFYCGHSCNTSAKNAKSPNTHKLNRRGRARDDDSPFRWYLLRIQHRVKHRRSARGGTDLTLEVLRGLWAQQRGVCPLTGWYLLLPQTTEGWEGGPPPDAASLDRVDNALGYTQGNVRFVALMANLARNRFSDEDVIRFCRAVATTHQAIPLAV